MIWRQHRDSIAKLCFADGEPDHLDIVAAGLHRVQASGAAPFTIRYNSDSLSSDLAWFLRLPVYDFLD